MSAFTNEDPLVHFFATVGNSVILPTGRIITYDGNIPITNAEWDDIQYFYQNSTVVCWPSNQPTAPLLPTTIPAKILVTMHDTDSSGILTSRTVWCNVLVMDYPSVSTQALYAASVLISPVNNPTGYGIAYYAPNPVNGSAYVCTTVISFPNMMTAIDMLYNGKGKRLQFTPTGTATKIDLATQIASTAPLLSAESFKYLPDYVKTYITYLEQQIENYKIILTKS